MIDGEQEKREEDGGLEQLHEEPLPTFREEAKGMWDRWERKLCEVIQEMGQEFAELVGDNRFYQN